MSNGGRPKDRVDQPAAQQNRRLWLPRLSVGAGLCLGAAVLLVAVLILLFGGTILASYGKRKAERAFAEAHPGSVLRLGGLDYAWGANRVVAQWVTLSATNLTFRAGRISLTGVRWSTLLWGKGALADVLAEASLEVRNLELQFPHALYGIRCARLRASVPGSELSAERTEFRPLVGDEAFFAADAFRTTRFQVVVPECRVLGLSYGELLEGKSYRARSVQFSGPTFDALVNDDKPLPPFVRSPLMVHEALATIRQPLQVDSLSITNGRVRYCEREVVGADPGVLTFGAVSLSVEGIANRGEAAAAIQLRGQGDLMDAGTLKLQMSIPIRPSDFSLHYSGSLSAMDLTRLNAFLDSTEHTRIKSGRATEAAFEIDVIAGQARGHVRAIYRDLEIAVLNKDTGSAKGLGNRITSFLANLLKVRSANDPDATGVMKEGQVNYTRKPEEEFLQFAWYALRTGVLDVISH
jgi:hypothetical protein